MTTMTQGDQNQTQPIPLAGATALQTDRPRSLAPAPVPRRSPGAGYLGIVLAVLLVALGIFALYEGIVHAGWADGPTVLTETLEGPAIVSPQVLTAVVGVVIAILGLWMLWTALRPSRQSGFSLGGATGTWMTYQDLERIAVGTAEDCDGVLAARARASRRRLDVRARTTTGDVRDTVRAAVQERLSAMATPPQVVVQVEPTFDQEGGAR